MGVLISADQEEDKGRYRPLEFVISQGSKVLDEQYKSYLPTCSSSDIHVNNSLHSFTCILKGTVPNVLSQDYSLL